MAESELDRVTTNIRKDAAEACTSFKSQISELEHLLGEHSPIRRFLVDDKWLKDYIRTLNRMTAELLPFVDAAKDLPIFTDPTPQAMLYSKTDDRPLGEQARVSLKRVLVIADALDDLYLKALRSQLEIFGLEESNEDHFQTFNETPLARIQNPLQGFKSFAEGAYYLSVVLAPENGRRYRVKRLPFLETVIKRGLQF